MSYLSTTIPVDVQPVLDAIKAVPKSFLHTVKLKDDLSGIEIIWDCDNIKTKYHAPEDYPVEKLIPDIRYYPVNDKVSVDNPQKKRSYKT